ncbi:hypothetical protein DZD18_00385 [Rhodobacteraceae bacterium W635]|uniref:hypothetical protein n=1 Tax=Nioella halotolerans TaxID=2303578 RepID=UPI000E3E7FDB|nr:hypothetical protein DZD18_00385 [Rhodobacteraceae bacterium W635]
MPVDVTILRQRGLVYIRYSGFARLDDTIAALDAYGAHPDFRPGQKQLVDMSRVTGMERDYVKFMKIQARKAEIFLAAEVQTLLVCYAPNRLAVEMAEVMVRSWEPSGAVIPMIQPDEAAALHILGQPEDTFEALLQGAP